MTVAPRSPTLFAAAMAVWLVAGWPGHVPIRAGALQGTCSISTTPVAFGSYNPVTPTALDGQGSVVYRCTGNRRQVQITISTGGSGTFARQMIGPTNQTLNYNLFLDATRQTIWGDGTAGTQLLTQTQTTANSTYTVTIYGRIPPGQNVDGGAYSDSLVVTLLG